MLCRENLKCLGVAAILALSHTRHVMKCMPFMPKCSGQTQQTFEVLCPLRERKEKANESKHSSVCDDSNVGFLAAICLAGENGKTYKIFYFAIRTAALYGILK